MKKIIKIQEFLPSTITSRKSIELLSKVVSSLNHTSIVFDFANIDFISRAFADELTHFISDNHISVDFQNVNPVINEMLEVVQKNMKKKDSSFHHIAVTPFMSQKEFAHFLSLV